ncbi:MAG: Bax inhibitor-1/YccA family protein [Alphaproteobacteria bacterium]|nr:Bax inhibitor-1/YccA family protein [Alphaproteobacteria bacterium]
MANGFDPRIGAAPRTATTLDGRAAVDAGLRSYMLSVYNYMASGVLLTAIVATAMVYTGAVFSLFNPRTGGATPLAWLVMLAPLGIVFWLSFGINRMRAATAKGLFWAYAGLLGASLSTVLIVYTASSVAQAFFATAAGFASLSLWGYTTKRDLTGWGSFLLVGLVGLVVAMLINAFWPSGPMGLAISVIGVLIFAGLTAYDTQKIKSMYFVVGGAGEVAEKTAVMGALALYLDFVNMFLFILRLFGDRR